MTRGDAAYSLDATRERNRLRLVDALRRSGTATRSELARATGLSRPTIAKLVSGLQAAGLVVESDGGGSGGRGRPPAVLRLDPSAGAAIGVDFGHGHVRVAIADLSSTVLAEECVLLDVDHDATAALDAATELVAHVVGTSGVDRKRVVAAGMGLPAPIDRRTGAVGSTTILQSWVGLRPAQELASRLDLHVELDNDANLGARAEHAFGAGRGLSDFVYVRLDAGIGGGLVIGGHLRRGAAGFAGEVGHTPVQPGGVVCRCGNRGCLETVASADTLLAALRVLHGDDLSFAQLLELVRSGDVGATRLVGDAGRAVGSVVAGLCNHLNPEAIVVGGALAGAGAPLVQAIGESLHRYALPAAAEGLEVRIGKLGERAEVLGALALVIGNTERLSSAGLVALGQPELAVAG